MGAKSPKPIKPKSIPKSILLKSKVAVLPALTVVVTVVVVPPPTTGIGASWYIDIILPKLVPIPLSVLNINSSAVQVVTSFPGLDMYNPYPGLPALCP